MFEVISRTERERERWGKVLVRKSALVSWCAVLQHTSSGLCGAGMIVFEVQCSNRPYAA